MVTIRHSIAASDRLFGNAPRQFTCLFLQSLESLTLVRISKFS